MNSTSQFSGQAGNKRILFPSVSLSLSVLVGNPIEVRSPKGWESALLVDGGEIFGSLIGGVGQAQHSRLDGGLFPSTGALVFSMGEGPLPYFQVVLPSMWPDKEKWSTVPVFPYSPFGIELRRCQDCLSNHLLCGYRW